METDRNEFLFHVMCSAIEGGIGYWAEIKDYKWGSNEGPYKLGWNLPDAERGSYSQAKVREADDYEVGPWRSLTFATIERGIKRLVTGEYSLNQDMMDCILGGSATNEAGNIDALCADAIVQVALLNKIVYG
jgi:hypothetical protein